MSSSFCKPPKRGRFVSLSSVQYVIRRGYREGLSFHLFGLLKVLGASPVR